MAERRKIGLIYQYDENWIGGTYYIQNLVAALNCLPERDKFELVIFTEEDKQFDDLINTTKYPFISRGGYVVKLRFIKRLLNRLGRLVNNKNVFSVYNQDIDLVFPADRITSFKKDQQFLYWIPDFQDHYLPEFFSENEIERRKKTRDDIIKNGKYIVFSSQTAKNDFNTIYPSNSLTRFVLNFAVTHPVLNDTLQIKEKYHLPDNYFICCNQFWKHKNHITVLKAIQQLKQEGHSVFVAFTGKEYDDRHPDFFKELMETVKELGVANQVGFLGFISREDQLSLMKESAAVIQPSLFEGWSTVIEDGKSLQAKIIASDINVHREQLHNYSLSLLFGAQNKDELAAALLTVNNISGTVACYKQNITAFAENFKVIFDTITSA